jgi:hypothetical protein
MQVETDGYVRDANKEHPYAPEEDERAHEYQVRVFGAEIVARCDAQARERADVAYCAAERAGRHLLYDYNQ